MNIFRFIADMLHLAAILLLLYRIKKARNCIGKYQSAFSLSRHTSASQPLNGQTELKALNHSCEDKAD